MIIAALRTRPTLAQSSPLPNDPAREETPLETTQRARDYSRTKDRLALISLALSLLSTAAFVFTSAASRFNARLLPKSNTTLVQRTRYTATISLISWLASLPLAFFSGHTIEKRYGLSNQPAAGWAIDTLKAKAISTPVELGIIEGIYATIRRWPRTWWLVCAGAVIPLTTLFAQLFPVLILPRFNKYEPLEDQALAQRLRDLTDRAGVSVADVMQMDMSRRTSKANAFFAGIGRTKRIVLADTMLAEFTTEEIEGVVAHETAHQVHKDIWRGVALSAVFTLVSAWLVDLIARRVLRIAPSLTGTSDLANPRSLPVIGLVMTLTGLLLTPLQLAWSRSIERKADRYAIALTSNPAAYAAAMTKLAETNLADPNPPRPITLLLHSHPPLAERIAAAEDAYHEQQVELG
jgi:STE24 endopeptidase